MSQHSRNWLKFGSLVALAFVLGLFFAGLLDIPRLTAAQSPGGGAAPAAPIAPVQAPRIPEARPLAELSSAFSAVAEAVRPSVVFVLAERPVQTARQQLRQSVPPGLEPMFPDDEPPQGGSQNSSGSGFVVSADGYILTNYHVIVGATRVRVRTLEGRTFEAQIVGSDRDTDVGVLKINAAGLTPAALGSSDAVKVGEWVLAIGNPLGADLTFSVTQGIVSAKGRGLGPSPERRDRDIQDFIQTDAAINRGNSGGPLVNVRGEVIGINTAIASTTGFYAGYAFAVPIDLARAVMNQIITQGHTDRTAMGVFVRTVTSEDAEYLQLDSIAGVKIDNFSSDDSPAKRAGLEPGDVIVSVDGTPVKYVAQLQQLVGFRQPGETVRLRVARLDGMKEFTVRLISVSPPQDQATAKPTPVTEEPFPNVLGVSVEPVTAQIVRQVRFPTGTRGLMVKAIHATSPAAEHLCPVGRQGCAPDVIVAVEGRPVRTEAELKAALARGGRNGVVTLTVLSNDSNQDTRIERVRIGQPE